jgi:hypothetical protein
MAADLLQRANNFVTKEGDLEALASDYRLIATSFTISPAGSQSNSHIRRHITMRSAGRISAARRW